MRNKVIILVIALVMTISLGLSFVGKSYADQNIVKKAVAHCMLLNQDCCKTVDCKISCKDCCNNGCANCDKCKTDCSDCCNKQSAATEQNCTKCKESCQDCCPNGCENCKCCSDECKDNCRKKAVDKSAQCDNCQEHKPCKIEKE